MVDVPQYTAGVRRGSAKLAHQEQPHCGEVVQVDVVCVSVGVCVCFGTLEGRVAL